MTENEAIKELETSIDLAKMCIQNCERKREIQGYEMAIKALEEVQQYRAIGTPEELKAAMKYVYLAKKHGTVGQVIENCVKYEAIGTVEECREAVEKQTAKKPEFVDTRFMNNGKHISDGCQLQKCYKCPNCNQHIFHVWDDELYCKYCGQHIDWSDGDDGN